MTKLYKIAILSYSTGGVATGIYVNNNLKKKIKISNAHSNFLLFYSSIAHGTYWPLYWSYRHIYKTNLF